MRAFFRNPPKAAHVAKAELGTKRICPETGRKFYDLNKDPIVSPFTGIAYPLSAFESAVRGSKVLATRKAQVEEAEEEEDDAAAPVFVPLDEVEEADAGDDVPDLEEAEIDDEAEDTFLEEEEDEGGDVTGIIVGGHEPEEER
jgi:uncharacterized protein (TIGR02300 family)